MPVVAGGEIDCGGQGRQLELLNVVLYVFCGQGAAYTMSSVIKTLFQTPPNKLDSRSFSPEQFTRFTKIYTAFYQGAQRL